MISVGSSTDAAIAAAKEIGEGAEIVRAHIPNPTYFILAPTETARDIPILQKRKGTSAQRIAVVGPDGTIRADTTTPVPL